MISNVLRFWRSALIPTRLNFIFLTTGANGTGKTAFTLKAVRDLQIKENRPVYWSGRFDLYPEKEKEFGWIKIEATEWQSVPPGAIFFFDECHNDFPDRSSGAKIPEFVKALGEHRKHGYDFFLLTQHPGNIDPFIRKIIASPGWHRHLKRNYGSSLISHIDYLAVCDRPEKPGAGKGGSVSMKALPKEVYTWYKSAELHTAKIKIPRQVWMFAAALCVIPLCAWGVLRYLSKTTAPKDAQSAAAGAPGAAGQGGGAAARVRTTVEYLADYQPRLPGLMHSAPAYDKLTEPKRVPVPAACVEMKSMGCKCYTQDATPYPVDLAMCRQLVAHGSFLAFLPEGDRRMPDAAPMPREHPEQPLPASSGLVVLGSGGSSPGAPTEVAAASPTPSPQPRVQAGTKWSFQPGG